MLQTAARTIRHAIDDPHVVEAVLTNAELRAINSFWEYRIYMNPRLVLRDMWFPRSLAWKLRKFYDAMKRGERPILLIQTPPQHGKSLSVIDFIGWACGHDPELRVIYSSFSDRLGIRANLRLQRALDSKAYRRLFPDTRLNDKHVLTNAELRAINSFWEYRIYMNPRLTLRDMWFPRSPAWKLRKFWDEMKAGTPYR